MAKIFVAVTHLLVYTCKSDLRNCLYRTWSKEGISVGMKSSILLGIAIIVKRCILRLRRGSKLIMWKCKVLHDPIFCIVYYNLDHASWRS